MDNSGEFLQLSFSYKINHILSNGTA